MCQSGVGMTDTYADHRPAADVNLAVLSAMRVPKACAFIERGSL